MGAFFVWWANLARRNPTPNPLADLCKGSESYVNRETIYLPSFATQNSPSTYASEIGGVDGCFSVWWVNIVTKDPAPII